MARMHTRKKGKAGSHRSKYTQKPTWVKMSEEEIVDVIIQAKKSGSTSPEIGIKLRDQYAVPSTKVILGKKIGKILKEKLSYYHPEESIQVYEQSLKTRVIIQLS